uniref:COMM domain-containing protein n=1 Tax=Caenorhabditis tropicalis TaxID=1561998 RepID=A0A1I7V534_9PELO
MYFTTDWPLIADKTTAESIWIVLTEAGRCGKLSEKLGDGDVANRMKESFEKIRHRLSSQLQTIQWKYDEIVDFDVKISKNNKSSLVNSDAQRVVVDLKILPAGEIDVQTITVDFDEAQLEDFIWKLKEAKTMEDRIQKYTKGR